MAENTQPIPTEGNHDSEAVMSITKLSIILDKNDLPLDIMAVFNDGRRLTLNYQRTWQTCFGSLSGNKRTGRTIEASYRHNIPAEIETSKMTRQDWANICFQYRSELEVVA